MSAFSYQHQQPPLLLESSLLYLQSSSPMRTPAALSEDQNIKTATTMATCFPQFYQPDQSLQQVPAKSYVNGSSCSILDQSSIRITTSLSNNNEPSLANKTCTNSSSVTDKLESGEQVTQKIPAAAVEKKRKIKEGPPVNSAQSKAKGDQGRGKKQRKRGRNIKEDEEKKIKEDEQVQKKAAEEAPIGYIRVRARRGQATDSHSLAERVRREKISERMKLLQAIVPGCDKTTGKALMLDEIINYVQSLQNQVEFLSMKLAYIARPDPLFYDFGMELDAYIARPDQTLSSMDSSMQHMQQCDQMQPPIISDINNSLTAATANNYSQLDNSASVLFQKSHHIPQKLSQANGQLLWDVDDLRQTLINQTGFNNNNLCSFH